MYTHTRGQVFAHRRLGHPILPHALSRPVQPNPQRVSAATGGCYLLSYIGIRIVYYATAESDEDTRSIIITATASHEKTVYERYFVMIFFCHGMPTNLNNTLPIWIVDYQEQVLLIFILGLMYVKIFGKIFCLEDLKKHNTWKTIKKHNFFYKNVVILTCTSYTMIKVSEKENE